MEAKAFYENRVILLISEQKKLQNRKSIFGILRLGSIIAIISIFYFLWSANKFYAIGAAIVVTIVFIQTHLQRSCKQSRH